MAKQRKRTLIQRLNHLFLRGLGILLPSVLTVWILIAAYNFVKHKIAAPINRATQTAVLRFTEWPLLSEEDLREGRENLTPTQRAAWRATGEAPAWLRFELRRLKLQQWWQRNSLWTDLIGLIVAAMAIYAAGMLVTSFIGARLYRRGERLMHQVPLIRSVYPSVKQVTEFLLGSQGSKFKFNRVVAVEYPRRGIWSLGLVTGEMLQAIAARTQRECLTVFIPSSPTPFTGYVITVPREDTIDLPMSIEDALRFVVSGGVLVPPSQRTEPYGEDETEEGDADVEQTPATMPPALGPDGARRTPEA